MSLLRPRNIHRNEKAPIVLPQKEREQFALGGFLTPDIVFFQKQQIPHCYTVECAGNQYLSYGFTFGVLSPRPCKLFEEQMARSTHQVSASKQQKRKNHDIAICRQSSALTDREWPEQDFKRGLYRLHWVTKQTEEWLSPADERRVVKWRKAMSVEVLITSTGGKAQGWRCMFSIALLLPFSSLCQPGIVPPDSTRARMSHSSTCVN